MFMCFNVRMTARNMCVHLHAYVCLTSSFRSSASSAFLSSSFLMTEWSSAIFSWNLLVSRSSTSCWVGGRGEEEEDNNWKKGEHAERQVGNGGGWAKRGWWNEGRVAMLQFHSESLCVVCKVYPPASLEYELYVHFWLNRQSRCTEKYGVLQYDGCSSSLVKILLCTPSLQISLNIL